MLLFIQNTSTWYINIITTSCTVRPSYYVSSTDVIKIYLITSIKYDSSSEDDDSDWGGAHSEDSNLSRIN